MLFSLPCQGASGELHGGPQPGDKAGRSLGWEAGALVYKPPESSLVLSRRIREGWLSPRESKGEAGARSGLLMGLCHCECHCRSPRRRWVWRLRKQPAVSRCLWGIEATSNFASGPFLSYVLVFSGLNGKRYLRSHGLVSENCSMERRRAWAEGGSHRDQPGDPVCLGIQGTKDQPEALG